MDLTGLCGEGREEGQGHEGVCHGRRFGCDRQFDACQCYRACLLLMLLSRCGVGGCQQYPPPV